MRDWSVLFCLPLSVADPNLQKRGGGGAIIQTLTGGNGLQKIFSFLRASAWSKNKRGAWPPPLDPPLLVNVGRGVSLKSKRLLIRDLPITNLPRC